MRKEAEEGKEWEEGGKGEREERERIKMSEIGTKGLLVGKNCIQFSINFVFLLLKSFKILFN